MVNEAGDSPVRHFPRAPLCGLGREIHFYVSRRHWLSCDVAHFLAGRAESLEHLVLLHEPPPSLVCSRGHVREGASPSVILARRSESLSLSLHDIGGLISLWASMELAQRRCPQSLPNVAKEGDRGFLRTSTRSAHARITPFPFSTV